MVGNSIDMSIQQPTYEESLVKIANLEKQINVLIAAKSGMDNNDDDKEMEASFKKAMDEMKDDDKEKSAMENENNKVKDAFKKAMDEEDDDKKHEAMKKAMEMKDEYDSKKANKTAMDDNDDDKKEHEAKVAAIVMKKVPIMNKILEATRIIDPSNLAKVEKELTAATLEEVEAKYATIQPYIAATGLGSAKPTPQGMPGMIPFQASTVVPDNSTDIFEASVDNIDFSKVKTSDIMGLYQ